MFIKLNFNVSYLCWWTIPNVQDSIKEKVLCFVRSKTFTDDLEAIVTSGACEVGSYIVVYANIGDSPPQQDGCLLTDADDSPRTLKTQD